MLISFMEHRTAAEKREILAKVATFPYCGFTGRMTGNVCYHYKSFVGRDYKAWTKMAPFIIHSYVSDDESRCWYLLCKVKFNYQSILIFARLGHTSAKDIKRIRC